MPTLTYHAPDGTTEVARTVMAPDPRRPGRPLALVTCWCGRAYSLTGEEIRRHVTNGTDPCPDPDCGKGTE